MPTRIIREGIITSESINRLSDSAEKFYRRLMSVADDYGRYYANPSLLRGACYPFQLDRVTDKEVSKYLAECVSQKLIFLYSASKYLQIVKFGQQCRSRSKFPQPTENELLIKCSSNDIHLLTQSLPAPNTNTTPSSTSDTTSTQGGCKGGFKRPTLDEVKLLAVKAGLPDIEAEKFWNHYESNGWRVGKVPMASLNGAMGGWAARWRQNGYLKETVKPDHSKGF